MVIKYRHEAYILYGLKFKPIIARKEMVDELTKKLKKQGFRVQRNAINAHGRLKYKKWIYY